MNIRLKTEWINLEGDSATNSKLIDNNSRRIYDLSNFTQMS